MTKEEFDIQRWTGGMKAKILGNLKFKEEYDVISVDFEYKTIELEIDKQCLDFPYGEIEITKQHSLNTMRKD